MPIQFSGEFADTAFKTANSGLNRYFEVPCGSATKFFKRFAVLQPDIAANELGMYSLMSVGSNDSVKIASFKRPKHLLQRKVNGCAWRPKGSMTTQTDEFRMCTLDYHGEQCPDLGECWDMIFATGNDSKDLLATTSGQGLFRLMLENIYEAIGNDFWMVVHYAGHPAIAHAEANGTYTGTRDEWKDFMNQQDQDCAGLITLVDKLAAEGDDNYNAKIYRNEVDGDQFIGNAKDALRRVFSQEPRDLRLINKRGRRNAAGQLIRGVVGVSRGIFQKLREEIIMDAGSINEGYHIMLSGFDTAGFVSPSTILFENRAIHCMDEWETFDILTGTHTHRILSFVPGVFGVAYDVPSLANQFAGLGMRIAQKLDPPDNGLTYMATRLKYGASILDKGLIVNASITIPAEELI